MVGAYRNNLVSVALVIGQINAVCIYIYKCTVNLPEIMQDDGDSL